MPRGGARPTTLLTVQHSYRITEHLHRVEFDAPGFDANSCTDMYVKLLFTSPDEVSTPRPVTTASDAGQLGPVIRRTYTVRSYDPATSLLVIDFVVHGDEGIAAPWAANCQPGDMIVAMGPGGGYAPNPHSDWHLFIADMSALPATAAALESLPDDARGVAYIHITDESDRIDLSHPSGIDIYWLQAPSDQISLLSDAIMSAPWDLGDVHVFAHGERESIKLIRRALREREIPVANISISGYWALGRTEDRFQAEKREPIGKI